jgi:hypothetical protein
VNSTLRDLSRKYATSPTWIRNVSKALRCEPNTPLWFLLDTAPSIQMPPDRRALEAILQ